MDDVGAGGADPVQQELVLQCRGWCARKELGFEVLFEVENVRNPFYKALNPNFNNSNCVDDFWGLKLHFETVG